MMTGKLFTSVTTAAIFAATSVLAPGAFAQSTTKTADPNAPAATAPAATAPATPAATGTYLTQQSPDQVSADTYIGQSVYNAKNESVGKVTDLIMEKKGGIVAAIVGVGGFLGIGRKDVAVPITNIEVAQNTQDGTVKLSTSETAESLKSAPEYKTLAMQAAEKAPANSTTGTLPTDSTATSSTNK
jgi:sporulation protein YlmC with PRC-barrel domain